MNIPMRALKIALTTLCLILHTSYFLTAQIAINSDGASPDASAILDITSTDKGILIPRMDSTSRNNISNPAEGLMVYDSTTASFWYYANATWNNIKQVLIADADNDTKIQVEESSDEDIIRFDIGGIESLNIERNANDALLFNILNNAKNVIIGEEAGRNLDPVLHASTFGYGNSFLGAYAGYTTTIGSGNLFGGFFSGYSNISGDSNTFLGSLSGTDNISGNGNTFLGSSSGTLNTTGSYNAFLGFSAGTNNTTGEYNIVIGYEAGHSNTTGSSNVFIGKQAGFNETGSNKLYIANSNTSTPLIYGDFDADSLQINGKLNINGAFEFPTTDGDSSQVLITDGNGLLSWQDNTTGLVSDADNDTKIQVEESSNEDIIRFDMNGTEFMRLDSGRIEIVNNNGSIFIGEDAGKNNYYIEPGNVFIGHEAGKKNTSGEDNLFIGYQSGKNNISGENNSFVGYETGRDNTIGEDNSFFGSSAGRDNTTGINNTFLGALAGMNHETGNNNTFIGSATGANSLSGNNNIFLGKWAGAFNRTGNKSVYIGVETGYNNQTGNNNIFIGYQAGYSETSSDKLYIDNSNTTTPLIYGEFDNNLLEVNGVLSVSDTIYGNNTAYFSGAVTGNDDYIATIKNSSNDNTVQNNGLQILAGHNTFNSNNSHFVNFSTPDGTTIGRIQQNASGVAYKTTSDIRLKTDIQPTKYSLSDILKIQVRDYHYKNDASKTPQTGFLAQQLHEVFPVAVTEGGDDAKTNPWTVDYSKMTPLLVKGMQEQQKVVQDLKEENNHLKEELNQLKSQVEKLSALEAKLEAFLQAEQ